LAGKSAFFFYEFWLTIVSYSFYATKIFKQEKITHVLTLLADEWRLMKGSTLETACKSCKHLKLNVDDNHHENLLGSFARTNKFIDEGLKEGGGVYVHWCV
jgi:dual specificity phosphatase 12